MSYISDHPTSFVWRPDVKASIDRVQRKFPYKTFCNTYWWHPPYTPGIITFRYDNRSVDYWGGGLSASGQYLGYRGKPIGSYLGNKVFDAVFNDPKTPNIAWIIWEGWMWTSYGGWEPAPWGPADSDPGHYGHIHVTYH